MTYAAMTVDYGVAAATWGWRSGHELRGRLIEERR